MTKQFPCRVRPKIKAFRAFAEPIRSVVGCFDLSGRLQQRQVSEAIWLLATEPEGTKLTDQLRLLFSLSVEYSEKNGEPALTTIRYDYEIFGRASADKSIFGWHWHPKSRRSRVHHPHLHVPQSPVYPSKHIPTGRVALEDVVLFAIDELGAIPTSDNARERVIESGRNHKRFRSWS